MHTARCLAHEGSIPTIIAPKRGEQVPVAAGQTSAGIPLRERGALLIASSVACSVELRSGPTQTGGAICTIPVPAGVHRVLPGADCSAFVTAGATAAAYAWPEDLAPLDPKQDRS